MQFTLPVIILFAITTILHAADQPAKDPASPLSAKLILKKDTYELSPDQSGEAFQKSLTDEKARKPNPPAVDITLQLTNTSKQAVTLVIGGDDSSIDLELTGPGAITVPSNMMMTRDFRVGKQTVLEPGKSLDIPITSLGSGMRNIEKFSYWTKPGQYTLKATCNWSTGQDQRPLPLTTDPVKIEVKGK